MSKIGSDIDDDNKTAKDLWRKLEELYSTANSQLVMKLKQNIE